MRENIMTKFRVTIASTIYYQAEIESESAEDIKNQFLNGDLDFTEWREIDLDSSIESIFKIKED
jgi:hypothetical protein